MKIGSGTTALMSCTRERGRRFSQQQQRLARALRTGAKATVRCLGSSAYGGGRSKRPGGSRIS
ncbi:hypothetical protein IF2G_10303 [Cordyceps javanica]|nr:hypothetical protein IF2G_10303 [Cordyceps javanica]